MLFLVENTCKKMVNFHARLFDFNKIHKVYKSLRICDYVSNKEKCKR